MALRARSRTLLAKAAKEGEIVLSGEGGLRGFIERVRERLVTGKLLRPDVEEDVLRLPVEKSQFRFPSPGEQAPAVVPQGPYKNVFDITYHRRDVRRRNLKEEVDPSEANREGLPPTPGNPCQEIFLGMAGDFDRQK